MSCFFKIWIPIYVCLSLTGCSSGSSSSPVSTGNEETNAESPPGAFQLVSISPLDLSVDVPVSSPIDVAFNKPVELSSFITGFQINPDVAGNLPACLPQTECKTVRFTPGNLLNYETGYTVSLRNQDIFDHEGVFLESPFTWSFTTAPFVSVADFDPILIDGAGISGVFDAGESTAIEIDQNGTIHIVYFSNSESHPRHAYCLSGCDLVQNWVIRQIDGLGAGGQQMGRDINLDIENPGSGSPRLHVGYRDASEGILKYALGTWDGMTWNWNPFIIDDIDGGITSTFLRFDAATGRIHISYRTINLDSTESLSYATCLAADCAESTAVWEKAIVDTGEQMAAPNYITFSGNAIHISYSADTVLDSAFKGTLKYATCLKAETCAKTAAPYDTGLNWAKVTVDDGGGVIDLGRDSSMTVEATGEIHVTYFDNDNADLKYAYCAGGCTIAGNWQSAAIDTPGQVGRSNQMKSALGKLHLSYRDLGNQDLKYARCDLSSDCLDPSQWTFLRIDAIGAVGWDTYLAVRDSDRTVHFSYHDRGLLALKYAVITVP